MGSVCFFFGQCVQGTLLVIVYDAAEINTKNSSRRSHPLFEKADKSREKERVD